MTMKKLTLYLLFAFMSCSLPAFAREISTAFIAFNLPDNWDCSLSDGEWVCKSSNEKSAQEAVIVFTAKEASPTDTLEAFVRHLSTPQNSAARGGGQKSVIISPTRQTIINGQTWIDSTHKDSEIKNYFTRYLATVKDGIAIAVTFTAHKDNYTKYNTEFFESAKSLRVTASRSKVANSKTIVPPGQQIEMPGTNTIPMDLGDMAPSPSTTKTNKTKGLLFILAVLLAGAALYALIRLRKK